MITNEISHARSPAQQCAGHARTGSGGRGDGRGNGLNTEKRSNGGRTEGPFDGPPRRRAWAVDAETKPLRNGKVAWFSAPTAHAGPPATQAAPSNGSVLCALRG